jgi:hypothetical protein
MERRINAYLLLSPTQLPKLLRNQLPNLPDSHPIHIATGHSLLQELGVRGHGPLHQPVILNMAEALLAAVFGLACFLL